VNRWESGQHKPNRHFQTQLCQLFGKNAEELGFMAEPRTTKEEISRTDTHRENITERSSLLIPKQSNETSEIPPLPSQITSQGIYDPIPLFHIDEATPEELGHFTALTETCRHLSEGNELKTAERILWAYLPRVESIAKLSFRDQRTAASITSQGYLLAASLVGHRNNLQARQRFSEQALLYGKLAQDHNLQITALRQLAVTYDYMGNPELVLQISQQAFPYLDDVSPLLRSCIYADVSGAYAQLNLQQEALRFLGLAYEHFPKQPDNEPGFLRTICRYSTLVLCDGLHHLQFDQPVEAAKIFARIDGLQPKIPIPERSRIDLLNCQVEVFIALRNMEQACHYLETAGKASLAIKSERRFQESAVVFQQLQAVWRNEPSVQHLSSLFNARRD
jgi:tetratricopeptide (TPR) repeat protein